VKRGSSRWAALLRPGGTCAVSFGAASGMHRSPGAQRTRAIRLTIAK
jgi:hypothetical protein